MRFSAQQAGLIREIYFRRDQSSAVLMLGCTDAVEAGGILGELPLAEARLIGFEIIPLGPYPGFARLFADGERTRSASRGKSDNPPVLGSGPNERSEIGAQ